MKPLKKMTYKRSIVIFTSPFLLPESFMSSLKSTGLKVAECKAFDSNSLAKKADLFFAYSCLPKLKDDPNSGNLPLDKKVSFLSFLPQNSNLSVKAFHKAKGKSEIHVPDEFRDMKLYELKNFFTENQEIWKS